jgi:hypothetical protein
LRQPLRAQSFRPWSARSLTVIEALRTGRSRLEAARLAGLDKANVRVIELRARRRGLLDDALAVASSPAPSPVRRGRGRPSTVADRDALDRAVLADPTRTNAEIAASVGVNGDHVRRARVRLGVSPNPRGRRKGFASSGPVTPIDKARHARIRLARAAGRTLADIGAEHGISREWVRQILVRYP